MSSKYRRSQDRAKQRKVEPIEIPEWPHLDENDQPIIDPETGKVDCTHYIRSMSVADRNSFDLAVLTGATEDATVDYAKVRTELLVRTWSDDKGNRLYADSEVGIVADMDGTVTMPAFLLAQRLNGMDRTVKND